MKIPDIRGATDEELLRYCLPTRADRVAPRLYTPLSVLAVLAVVGTVSVVTFSDGSTGFGPFMVGMAIIIVLLGMGAFAVMGGTAFFLGLAERRSGSHREELSRRLGQGGIDDELGHLLELEDREAAADYTILLTGQEMPGDRCYWARLDLETRGQREAALEYKVGPRLDLENDPDSLGRMVSGKVSLKMGQEAELVSFLEGLDLEKLRSVKACFINGMPCEVALLQRGSDTVYRGGCNYVEQDDRATVEPVMRLVGIMLGLVRARL